MALACILKRFKFERSADTQVSVLCSKTQLRVVKFIQLNFQTYFSHVALRDLKNNFREQIWVPAPRRRIGVSVEVFGTYDVV